MSMFYNKISRMSGAVGHSPFKGGDIMSLNDIFILSQIVVNSLFIIKIIKELIKYPLLVVKESGN